MRRRAGVALALAVLVAASAALAASCFSTPSAAGTTGSIVFANSLTSSVCGCPSGAVWVIRTDGSALEKLHDDNMWDGLDNPVWSPNGMRVAFGSLDGAFVMNRDGTHRRAGVCGFDLHGYTRCEGPVDWSPDGQRLAVTIVDGGPSTPDYVGIFDLRRRTLDLLKGSAKVADVDSYLDWSPDGKMIAIADSANKLWLMRPDGTGVRQIADDIQVHVARWSPDSKTLLLGTMDGGIYTYSVSDAKATIIRQVHGDYPIDLAWSPNGRQIIYSGHGLVILDLATRRSVRVDTRTHICSRTDCYGLDWTR